MTTVSYFKTPGGRAGIVNTLERMRDIVHRSIKVPQLIALARQLTSGLEPRDYSGEIQTIFEWVRDNIRYAKDIEGHETLIEPYHLVFNLELGRQGDCDDFSMLLATLLKIMGHRVRFKAGTVTGGRQGHVFAEVWQDNKWIPLDAIYRNNVVGYCPPNMDNFIITSVEGCEEDMMAGAKSPRISNVVLNLKNIRRAENQNRIRMVNKNGVLNGYIDGRYFSRLSGDDTQNVVDNLEKSAIQIKSLEEAKQLISENKKLMVGTAAVAAVVDIPGAGNVIVVPTVNGDYIWKGGRYYFSPSEDKTPITLGDDTTDAVVDVALDVVPGGSLLKSALNIGTSVVSGFKRLFGGPSKADSDRAAKIQEFLNKVVPAYNSLTAALNTKGAVYDISGYRPTGPQYTIYEFTYGGRDGDMKRTIRTLKEYTLPDPSKNDPKTVALLKYWQNWVYIANSLIRVIRADDSKSKTQGATAVDYFMANPPYDTGTPAANRGGPSTYGQSIPAILADMAKQFYVRYAQLNPTIIPQDVKNTIDDTINDPNTPGDVNNPADDQTIIDGGKGAMDDAEIATGITKAGIFSSPIGITIALASVAGVGISIYQAMAKK